MALTKSVDNLRGRHMKRGLRALRRSLLTVLCCLTMVSSSVSALAVYAENGDGGEGGDPAATVTIHYEIAETMDKDGKTVTPGTVDPAFVNVEIDEDKENVITQPEVQANDGYAFDAWQVDGSSIDALPATVADLSEEIIEAGEVTYTAVFKATDKGSEPDVPGEPDGGNGGQINEANVKAFVEAAEAIDATEEDMDVLQGQVDAAVAAYNQLTDIEKALDQVKGAYGYVQSAQAVLDGNDDGHGEPEADPEEADENGISVAVGDITYTITTNSDGTCKVTGIAVTDGATCPSALTIPASLTVGDQSYTISEFSLKSPALPSGVKSVAFDDAIDLSNCTSMFKGCTTIESVTLPAATSVIPSSMFNGCSALKTVTSNGTIAEIGNYAFNNCTVLTSIPDLSKVTSMGQSAFYECNSLKVNVDLSSLNEIPDKAFSYAPVTVTAFSNSLTSIGIWAFINSTIQAEFPESLQSIGTYAFWYATMPETVTLPDSLTEVGASAFNDVSGVKTLKIGTTRTQLATFESMAFLSDLQEVIVASSEDEFYYKPATNKYGTVKVTYLGGASAADEDSKISYEEGALTLQQAINRAQDGDTIVLKKNVTVNYWSVKVPAGKNITIASEEGQNYTIIEVRKYQNLTTQPLFDVQEGANVTFENVTINAKGAKGGAIKTAGTVTLGEGAAVSNMITSTATAKASAINVAGSNAQLVIDGGSVKNNTINGSGGASIRVSDGGKVDIKSGEISGNKYTAKDADGTSGVLLVGNASGSMSGGKISGNTACRGAAISLLGTDDSNKTTFELSGGEISGNKCVNGEDGNSTAAGAVYVYNNAAFTMNDGTITGNTSADQGGGVTVYDWKTAYNMGEYPAQFIMNGGTISNNTAENSGGGIYSYSNGTVLNAGTISGNTAGNHGGGIYIEGGQGGYSTARLVNAYVSDNSAKYGGGLWSCATGNVTDDYGILNGNTASTAGDDAVLAYLYRSHTHTLSDTILGGGEVRWYHDGKVGNTLVPQTDPEVRDTTRYPNTAADPVTVDRSQNPLALKSVIDKEDLSVAKDLSTLFITDNYAPTGGGIGINGGVDIDATPIKVQVKKAWKISGNHKRTAVTVQLQKTIVDPKDATKTKVVDEGDAVELNEGNDWSHTWENLDAGIKWSVKEVKVPDGFTVSTSKSVNVETRTVIYTLTNSDKPDKPDEPHDDHHDGGGGGSTEETPVEEVQEPGEIVEEIPEIHEEGVIESNGAIVTTGDEAHMMTYAVVVIMAAIVLAGWYVAGRRDHI